MYRKAQEIYTESVLDRFFFNQHIDDEENILLVAHRHWVFGVKGLIFPTVVFISLWFFLWYATAPIILYSIGIAIAFTTIWWLRAFLDYYLDAWIITNKGVIDLSWHGWFHRTSSRILYSDIQGVSYEIKGIAGTLMRYGDIAVEKISTGTEVTLPGIPKPRKIQTVIMEAMEHYLHKKNLKDADTVQKILSEFVAGQLQTDDLKKLLKK